MLSNGDLFSHLNELAAFKCCVNDLPESNHLLPDFFNIADLQLTFVMSHDSINIVL